MPTWQHSDKNGSTCTTYYRTIKYTLCHKQDFNYYIKNHSKSKFRCLHSLTFYLSESMMKKVLKRFMEKWTDRLCRWLFDAHPSNEEAMA